MGLAGVEYINGTLSTIFVFLSVLIGIKIALKYREYKKPIFLLFGATWILIVEPWYPMMVSFLVALVNDKGLTLEQYLLIGVILVPLGIIIGVATATELLFKEQQRLILIIFVIIGAVFEIFFVYSIFNEPTWIGELNGIVDLKLSPIAQLYLLTMLGVILFLGILFSRESLKSDEHEIKLKGKMILVAFITYSIGAAIEATIPLNLANEAQYILVLLITRIILIFSAIAFYCGFYLPKFMKRLFSKE